MERTLSDRLIEAIEGRSQSTINDDIETLIDLGADVNMGNLYNNEPLHRACKNNNIDCLKLFLHMGAKITEVDRSGCTVLHIAAERNDEFVAVLIQHGADINAVNKYKCTPLHQAAEYNKEECVKLLLQHGDDVNVCDCNDYTPLQIALGNSNNTECVKLLLHHGADFNVGYDRTYRTYTPLHWAVYHDDVDSLECVELVSQHSADINVGDSNNTTPLHLAAKNNNVKYANLLLHHGADVNAPDDDGETPLHGAAGAVNFKCVELLLQHGADVNTTINVNNGYTPLYWPVSCNNVNCVQLLLQHGADVNVHDYRQEGPLSWAVCSQSVDCLKLLLEFGATDNVIKQLSLNWAVYCNDVESIKLLLQYGADINGSNGIEPPLQMAVVSNNAESIKRLFQLGADANGGSFDDIPLLHLTFESDHVKLFVKLMLQHGANVDVQDNNHNTLLNLAANCFCLEVINILLEYNANVNNRNLDGQTPLMQVAIRGNKRRVACLEILIQASGQFDLRNELGKFTPAIACDNEISEMLLPYCVNPRSLQVLCRHQIRSSLHLDVVPLLNLPKKLHKFVLLQC